MKLSLLLLPVVATAFSPSSSFTRSSKSLKSLSFPPTTTSPLDVISDTTTTQVGLFKTKTEEAPLVTKANGGGAVAANDEDAGEMDDAKKLELILLGVWGISISAFILINNFSGPWPAVMKTIPERVFFLNHMVGGMLFGGGIILTTCIERLVAKSSNAPVLQFWFTQVPVLDGLIVVPALTVSMVSGTGLAIARYGGLNIAPPHVGAIFWTLIAFMTWWAATDLTTQGTSLQAVEKMYDQFQDGEDNLETPKVVTDRHVSNVVSCFFVLALYSMMVLKPGTYFPFPWQTWT